MDDLYTVLGVARTSTEREIRSAYRRLAREYHPDVSRSPETASRFSEIAEAYRVLGNREARALYDRGEYNPRRRGRAAAPSAAEAERERAERVAAYNSRINRIVDEMIEEERFEIRKRAEAVSIVVTLFASTFLVSVARPSTVGALPWWARIFVLTLFTVGVWYLAGHLKNVFRNFTYRPEMILSVTALVEAPRQPFTRATAWGFLAVGYVLSLIAGNALGSVIFVEPGETVSVAQILGSGFLYPPIAVLIVDHLRRLGEFMDRVF